MIRCYLTGVAFPQDQGFVLNRRAARELLIVLRDRVASLNRVIEQLSPLDELPPNHRSRASPPGSGAPRAHRLVCKAVAQALAPGFPEISLFLAWPDYRARTRRVVQSQPRTEGEGHEPGQP